jgi:amino acid transporter
VAVIVGSVIGSGVFKKPQEVAQNVPHFEWAAAAWILGGVLALLGALALAELGAMMPRAGGNYVFLKEAYGPLWGFLWGWIEFWIVRTGSIAALATIFSESLHEILKAEYPLDPWQQRFTTASVIALLSLVNAAGVRWGGLVQNLTTWLKVASLVAIGLLPFVVRQAHFEYLTPSWSGSKPLTLAGFGAALLGVMWAYHGWMNLSPLGEELRDPQRSVPRALLLGVGIVMAVYLFANLAYALVLPQSRIAEPNQIVAVSFARQAFQDYGSKAMALAGAAISAAIMLSVFGALNANILIGPRTYYALGRDGLFPSFFGEVHATYRTPVLSILVQAVWAIGLVLGSDLLKETQDEALFDTLTNFVMFGAIIFETMVIAAIFRFRRLLPDLPRPYRCWGYPTVPFLYVVILSLVLVVTVYNQPVKSAAGLAFILTGALVHFLSTRRK